MKNLVVAGLALWAMSAQAQEKVDLNVVEKIRAEGLQRSQVMETFNHLVNVIGPRLTASPAYKRAVDWTRDRLAGLGLDNVHLEPWEFGRGWQLERFSVEMLEPRYMPMLGYPKGWSPSTKGKLTGTPLWLGGASPEDLQKYAGRIANSIVLTRPIQDDFITEDRPPASGDLRRTAGQATDRQRDQAIIALLQKEHPGVTLEPNYGTHGTLFVTGRDGGADAVPSVVLAPEHYNLIARLLQQNVPARLAVDVQGRFFEQDKNAYNVIAVSPLVDDATFRIALPDPWRYRSVSVANPLPDGSFRMTLPEGDYQVAAILPRLFGRLARVYSVKSLTSGSTNLRSEPLRISGAEPLEIRATFSTTL